MKRYYKPHCHLSQGEMAVEVEAGTLGELIQSSTKVPPRYRTDNYHHHRTEAGLGAHCQNPNDRRNHYRCFKRNCTCPCHRRGGK